MSNEALTQRLIENPEEKFFNFSLQNFRDATGREEYKKYALGNPYAEVDVAHFEDMANLVSVLWQKIEGSKTPLALKIAALYHDFDRVFPENASNDPCLKTIRRVIDTKSVKDLEYGTVEGDPVKFIVHPENCAAIFRDYNKDNLSHELLGDISFLIERHELGAEQDPEGKLVTKLDAYSQSYNLNKAAEILCEADGISFFTVIIYSYAKGRSIERIKKKIAMSYRKLKDDARSMVREISYTVVSDGNNIIDIGKLVHEVAEEIDNKQE